MKNFHRITYENISEALRKHLGLDFLHENIFFHPKQPKCIAKGSWTFWNSPPPLFIGKKGGACRPEASWGSFLSAPKLLSSLPFRTLRKSYRSLTEVFRIWFSSFFLFPFTNVKSNMLTQGCQKFYGSITETTEALETIFQKTWRSLPPSCFLLKQPNFQNVPKGPRFELLFTPYLDKFTLPFLCFWPFSFRNLTKLYRFHRDEC